jgi:hypothetical protein
VAPLFEGVCPCCVDEGERSRKSVPEQNARLIALYQKQAKDYDQSGIHRLEPWRRDISHCCSSIASLGINRIVEHGFCGRSSLMRAFRSVTASV